MLYRFYGETTYRVTGARGSPIRSSSSDLNLMWSEPEALSRDQREDIRVDPHSRSVAAGLLLDADAALQPCGVAGADAVATAVASAAARRDFAEAQFLLLDGPQDRRADAAVKHDRAFFLTPQLAVDLR